MDKDKDKTSISLEDIFCKNPKMNGKTLPLISSRAEAEEEKCEEKKKILERLFTVLSPPKTADAEAGGKPPDSSIPDVHVYQQKKTMAQGMFDLALFSANVNQLRYVMEVSNSHPYFYPNVVFIVFSIALQVAVGAGLIWNATCNVKDKKEICIANKANNFTIIGIFLITTLNVFISAFGVGNAPPGGPATPVKPAT